MRIYATNNLTGQRFKLELTPAQARKHDNGALISCGLTIPDDMSEKTFNRLKPVLVDNTEYQHSGCQSKCKERGYSICQW